MLDEENKVCGNKATRGRSGLVCGLCKKHNEGFDYNTPIGKQLVELRIQRQSAEEADMMKLMLDEMQTAINAREKLRPLVPSGMTVEQYVSNQ